MHVSANGHGPAPAGPAPVSLQQVLETIKGALEVNEQVRSNAETLIKGWEQNAVPGFLLGLLEIVRQTTAVDESIRLLAVVIAKNTVGSSWKKTLGTREWSRVPDEEKAAVREGVLQLMLSDPSDRVALQLALLVTNIARFDFPGKWENLLALLTSAASMESAFPPPMKLRALKALRHVLNGLTTKRFVIDQPKSPLISSNGQSPQELLTTEFFSMSERIAQERALFKQRVNETYGPLQQIFLQHSTAFLSCSASWDLHALFAKAAAKAYNELLLLAPATEELPPGTKGVLEHMHTVGSAVGNNKPQGALDPSAAALWAERGGRLYEAVLACCISHLTAALPFAEYVPHFLQLYVQDAIIATDASRLRAMRAKRRVLLVRFIAKALLCPFYRPEFTDAPPLSASASPEQVQKVRENVARALKAQEAVSRMLSVGGGWCGALVEALIAKYVALTQQELEEWAVDPEGYLRSVDVESSPDADTPRPIGVGLLLCMLERGAEPVATTLLQLAGRLQASGNNSAEVVLLREATYRVIGEGFTHLAQHISFTSWFASELAPLLHSQASSIQSNSQEVLASVLQARALWLVGVCGSTLPQEQWVEAYRLATRYMAAGDLVVALMAASAVLALSAAVMEDQQALEQWGAQQRAALGGASRNAPQEVLATEDALEAQSLQEEREVMMEEVRTRVEARVAALEGTMREALSGCFQLLARLGEVESMVRVLQLVSMLVEVMADRVRPHLGTIAEALPHIWSAAIAHSSSGDTGAIVRLHSALIAVLTHLVTKLRGVATQDARVMGVVLPLLQFATNLGGPESEVLVEEAFRLWNTTISSLPAITPQLLELLPNLNRILQRGKDNSAVYPLIESYLFMGQASALEPIMQPLAASILRSINNTAKALQPTQEASGKVKPAVMAAEVAQEALATTALMDVLLQLFPTGEVLQLLMPPLKALTALIATPTIPMQGLGTKVVNLFEGALEVLARVFISHPSLFPALADNDPALLSRFCDRWLTVASTRFVEEMIGVRTMTVLGRFRRRVAAMSMCCLLAAGTAPVLLERNRAIRVVSLLLQAAGEVEAFQADQAELDSMDFKEDLGEDTVLARRFEFARGDVLRSPTLVQQVRIALQKVAAAVGGQQQLLALCNQQSHRLGADVQAALNGTLPSQRQQGQPQQQQQQQQQQHHHHQQQQQPQQQQQQQGPATGLTASAAGGPPRAMA